MIFDNVVLGNPGIALNDLCEHMYLEEAIRALHTRMGEAFFDFNFVIYSGSGEDRETPILEGLDRWKPSVLFYITDETSSIPAHLCDDFCAIFKNYLPYDRINNIFSLPLGHVSDIPAFPYKEMDKRRFNVFFSGRLNYYRMDFYMQFLSSHTWLNNAAVRPFMYLLNGLLPKDFPAIGLESYISFTSGFREGIDPRTYGKLLADSKIALCPRGFISPETFRHFEAMRAGCVIISEPLPGTYYYKHAPIITVNDWAELGEVVSELLAHPVLLDELSRKTAEWWQNRCSGEAVAAYIEDVLQTCFTPLY